MVVSIIAAFIKRDIFSKLFALFTASIFAILMTYQDVNKIFIVILISFALNFVILLTSKEYK